jgi:hypothetical protein
MADLQSRAIFRVEEQRLIELYRTIAPTGNYETVDGEVIKGNRFADQDDVVIRLREEING